MALIIEPEDLKIMALGNTQTSFPITPDAQREIRDGAVTWEFWRDRHLNGPFRPVAIAPEQGGVLDAARRVAANKLVLKKLRTVSLCNRAIYGNSKRPAGVTDAAGPLRPIAPHKPEVPKEADMWNLDLDAETTRHAEWLAQQHAENAARRLAHSLRKVEA